MADEGAFSTTTIEVSKDGKTVATGSKMGTVNIFTFDKQTQRLSTKPAKTIMNLTTSITDLKFNPKSNLLAFCSKWKKNAIRLVHIPSYTTYQNFPGSAAGILKYPFNIDFSYSGEYMVMGNDEGKAHLWHIPYFMES